MPAELGRPVGAPGGRSSRPETDRLHAQDLRAGDTELSVLLAGHHGRHWEFSQGKELLPSIFIRPDNHVLPALAGLIAFDESVRQPYDIFSKVSLSC